MSKTVNLLKCFVRGAHIQKLASLFKQLTFEPRYVLQVLKGFPKVAARHLFLGDPILYVRRFSGIGDIICTFPSLMALRRTEPTAMIIYETRRHNMPLVARCRVVDLVVEEGSPLARMCQKLFTLKLSLYPLLPDEHTPKRHCERIHLTEEFRKSFGLLAVDNQSVCLEATARAKKEIFKWSQSEGLSETPLVVIHTGPTWKTREWPVENWDELVTQIKSEFRAAVVQIGQDSFASGEASLSPRAVGAIDRVGELSLDEMLALLKVADLFVGIDSGMLHLAGAVHTSCVGIFGPTEPSCRLPTNSPGIGVTAQVPCVGCHHNEDGPGHWLTGCPHNIRCMSNLTVEDVFRACSSFLKTPSRSDCRVTA
jgi:ADP-heptose:LPS heptosyltransferase